MTHRLFLIFSFVFWSLSSFAAEGPYYSVQNPCSGTYTGFYDGVGPVRFDFVQLQDDAVRVRLHYQGVIHNGYGTCRADWEEARVSLQFHDAPSHEGEIHRESDKLMFRGFQTGAGLNFTAERR